MAIHPLQLSIVMNPSPINARHAINNGTPRDVVFMRPIDRGAQPETKSKL